MSVKTSDDDMAKIYIRDAILAVAHIFFHSFIRYSVVYQSVINTPSPMFDNRQEFFQHLLIIFDNV